jgi:hypothetical protein
MSSFVESAGPNLNGCPYCALIVVAATLQADFLVKENSYLGVHFSQGNGLVIRDTGINEKLWVTLQVYTPLGECLT